MNVIEFPKGVDPDDVLTEHLGEFEKVGVIGFTRDGHVAAYFGGGMTVAEAVFCLEDVKLGLLNGSLG